MIFLKLGGIKSVLAPCSLDHTYDSLSLHVKINGISLLFRIDINPSKVETKAKVSFKGEKKMTRKAESQEGEI